ncbi:ABC transporter substrate-binding protein [Actinomyces lilanjuaniae]|uniref:ABC transporter substrate-binding protein n=1 Tax=Actinomyces lilanjuaniae TaxID=2321394 RepID=A0ABM6Z3G5_9ACTO|nr:transporter substrate-binding domain-containing protein [Actinomyces lilanjuaniae]AYD89718.1 ABC transporter substrate-binding protein [Actinomyces lilanjuaniae]
MTTRRPLLVAAVACLVLGGCTHAADWRADSSAPSTGTYDVSGIQVQPEIAALLPEEVLADGVLDVAASTDYAPAEFLDTQGSPIGYDVDLSRAVAAVLGVSSQTHTAEFDSIIAAVGSKYDVGISSFTITSARTLEVDMLAYINVGSRFNVAAGNPEGIDVSDHLNLCGYTVGVQVGTAQETSMNELAQSCRDAGHPALSVRAYSTQSEAATSLASNVIDALYSDSTVADYAVELTDGAVQTLGEVEDALPQGIVISKTDPQLAAALQAAVQHLMDEGVWEEILAGWGIEDAALDTAALNPAVEG